MTVGPWVATDAFATLLSGVGLDGEEVFKVALFGSDSNLSTSSTTYAGVTGEHPQECGYVTGGVSVTVTGSDTAALTVVPEFTATSGEFVARGSITARYAALYEVGGDVAAFCLLDDTPADVTVQAGQTLRVESPDVVVVV